MIAIAVPHVEPVPDACLKALIEGDAVATDLCEGLVAFGVPFRLAYAKVGALVARQRAAGRRLAELSADDLEAAGLPRELVHRLQPADAAHRRA
jgi:argininosuccinate lyase